MELSFACDELSNHLTKEETTMKKLLLTTLVTTALGASALAAGTISMDGRADYEANTFNDAANRNNNTRFNIQTLRVDAKGNLDEATQFRLRYRFNNPTSGINAGTSARGYNQRDSVNRNLDFAYVQRKFMDNLSLQVGKFNTDIGGIEGMTSGPDLYFTSQAYQEQNEFRYATGAKLMFNFAENHEIDLMSTNQEVDVVDANPAGAGTSFGQNHETYGVVYKGSFMDKTLQPVLSWHNDKTQPTTASNPLGGLNAATPRDVDANYYAAGLKWDFAPVFVEADYLYDTFKDLRQVGDTDKTTSIVATVGGRMDNWVGKLKYEHSEAEAFTAPGTSGKTKYDGYQAAVEYLPTNDKTFRYHVAYVSRDTKPETGDTQTTQTVFVGTRILADFLK
jgi:hypothetical protein